MRILTSRNTCLQAKKTSCFQSYPIEIVALDHVKLEPSASGCQYALTITDHFSKFLILVPARDLTAKTTAELFLKHFAQPYGCPDWILTDQSPAFESKIFHEFCSLYGCRKVWTTAYHPQEKGLCERASQTIIGMLRSLLAEKRSYWPTLLPELIYLNNNTEHCSTGFTPFYLMCGQQGKLPSDLELIPEVLEPVIPKTNWECEHHHQIETTRQLVSLLRGGWRSITNVKEKRYNTDAWPTPLQVGDKV